MLNNMCLDLAFQPFPLLCCRQPSPTSQRLHTAGDPDWPWADVPAVKRPEQITTKEASKPKGEITSLEGKQVHIKSAEHFSFKYAQLGLNIAFDFQASFLLLISPFCSECAKSA